MAANTFVLIISFPFTTLRSCVNASLPQSRNPTGVNMPDTLLLVKCVFRKLRKIFSSGVTGDHTRPAFDRKIRCRTHAPLQSFKTRIAVEGDRGLLQVVASIFLPTPECPYDIVRIEIVYKPTNGDSGYSRITIVPQGKTGRNLVLTLSIHHGSEEVVPQEEIPVRGVVRVVVQPIKGVSP